MREAWTSGNGTSTASKKGRKDSVTQTKPLAECVHDKLCKANSGWKFPRAAKTACALDPVEQERRPVPYLRVAAAPRHSSAAETRRRGPLGAATATKVSFCRLTGEGKQWSECDWEGQADGNCLCSPHRGRRQIPNFFFLRQPASQPGSTACRTPSSLLSSLPTSIFCTPLPNLT